MKPKPKEAPKPEPTGKDTLNYCADLDWFFGVSDAMSGHRSSMGAQIAVLRSGSTGRGTATESNRYGDGQVAAFGRARRVFATLKQLPGHMQWILERHYSPKKNRPKLAETDVARAHRRFYEARNV